MSPTATMNWKKCADVTEQTVDRETTGDNTRVSRSAVLPAIKGVDSLRDVCYSVDLERSVEEMAHIISKMEAQLERVLSLNSVLETDMNTSKEIIANLLSDKEQLAKKIARLEAETPSKREFQMEIDQLIDERTAAQNMIHELNVRYRKLQDSLDEARSKIVRLETEKEDAVSEINFLEARQNATRQQHNGLQSRIDKLKEEKVGYQRKIIALQEECQKVMEDKYTLIKEMQKLKEEVADLRATLTDNRVKVRKDYYDSADLLRKR